MKILKRLLRFYKDTKNTVSYGALQYYKNCVIQCHLMFWRQGVDATIAKNLEWS